MAIISDRIFELIKERGLTQKEFSRRTDIAESTISDWKRRGANPASEKLLIISQVLEVSVEELLSGVKKTGERGASVDYRVIADGSEEGIILEMFDELDRRNKDQLLGYLKALHEMRHK